MIIPRTVPTLCLPQTPAPRPTTIDPQMTAGARLQAVVVAVLLLLLVAGTLAQGQIRTRQVTTTLILDTTSYSGAMRSAYSAQFVTDLSLAIGVSRARFVLPALTTADASTSYISFVVLPPTAPSDPTALQVFDSYSAEIRRPGSPLLSNALALHLDPTSTPQTAEVSVYQCGDGSYVLISNACPGTATTEPSSDAIDSATLMTIEIASAGVIVAVIVLIVAVVLRRRQRQSEYRSSAGPATLTQQAAAPNGVIMAKIITTDDGAAAVPNFPNPYREVQPILSASYGAPPPYPTFSPPISVQNMPMAMVPMQYTIGPMPTQAPAPYQDPASQQGVVVDPMSMSTTTATKQGQQPSRIVKKGMNLKQIRQKRIGLDAPQIDQGDESMPDTDTDF